MGRTRRFETGTHGVIVCAPRGDARSCQVEIVRGAGDDGYVWVQADEVDLIRHAPVND
jgi:hypothetical protein